MKNYEKDETFIETTIDKIEPELNRSLAKAEAAEN